MALINWGLNLRGVFCKFVDVRKIMNAVGLLLVRTKLLIP